MSLPLPRTEEHDRHAIGSFIADFAVLAEDGPLCAPERLAQQVRAELLPALEAVFAHPDVSACDAVVDQLEIDLGHWPAAPDWPALRAHFQQQVLTALSPYLRKRRMGSRQLVERRADAPAGDQAVVSLPAPAATSSESARVAAQMDAHLRLVEGQDVVSILKTARDDDPALFQEMIRALPDPRQRRLLEAVAAGQQAWLAGAAPTRVQQALISVFRAAGHDPQVARGFAARLTAQLLLSPIGASLSSKSEEAAAASWATPRSVDAPRPTHDSDPSGEDTAQPVSTSKAQADAMGPPDPSPLDLADVEAVKSAWRTAPHHVEAQLRQRDAAALRALLRVLLPKAADDFHTAVDAAQEQTEAAQALLIEIVRSVLDGRPIDLVEARATAEVTFAETRTGSQETASPMDGQDIGGAREVHGREDDWATVLALLERGAAGRETVRPELSEIDRSQRHTRSGSDGEAEGDGGVLEVVFMHRPAATFARDEGGHGAALPAGRRDTVSSPPNLRDDPSSGERRTPDGVGQYARPAEKDSGLEPLPRRDAEDGALDADDLSRDAAAYLQTKDADLAVEGPSQQQGRSDDPQRTAVFRHHRDGPVPRDGRALSEDAVGGEEPGGHAGSRPSSLDGLEAQTSVGSADQGALTQSSPVDPDLTEEPTLQTRFDVTEQSDSTERPDQDRSAQSQRDAAAAVEREAPTAARHPTSEPATHGSAAYPEAPLEMPAQRMHPGTSSQPSAEDTVERTGSDPRATQAQPVDAEAAEGQKGGQAARLSERAPSDAESGRDEPNTADQEPRRDGPIEPQADRGGPASADATAAIDALSEAAFGATAEEVRDILALVWSVLPDSVRRDVSERLPDLSPRPDGMAAEDDLTSRVMLALIASIGPLHSTLGDVVRHLLDVLVPELAAQEALVRQLVARLRYAAGGRGPGLRHRVIAALERRFETATPPSQRDAEGRETQAGPATHLLLTRHAGLVLFHPFLKLLFSRLEVLTPDNRMIPERLPLGRAALEALAGVREPQQLIDPLCCLLLGLADDRPPPAFAPLDEAQDSLIDGLMRSVIAQWSKLGQTSPQGLQDAFIRRGGQIRFDEAGAHLRVDPGPFDMLLDGLPWTLDGPVALPWMTTPCHVSWRSQDG